MTEGFAKPPIHYHATNQFQETPIMPDPNKVTRRTALGSCVAAAGGACAFAAGPASSPTPASAQEKQTKDQADKTPHHAPFGKIGDVKISRMLLGGNLVSGYMHARDLKYVGRLFRAYVTEEKIFETFALAEQHGINTVLESGANLVQKYNQHHGGHMRIIPSVHPSQETTEAKLKDEIRKKIDVGCAALYVWGVAGDKLVKAGEVDLIAKAVQLIQDQGIPAGVGGHSLEVPKQCEKHQVPCDFYVKTLHMDSYPSAVPKPARKDFICGSTAARAGTTICGASIPTKPYASCRPSPSPGSPSRSWPPEPSHRAKDSPTPSTAGPISSASACSTSRSKKTAN